MSGNAVEARDRKAAIAKLEAIGPGSVVLTRYEANALLTMIDKLREAVGDLDDLEGQKRSIIGSIEELEMDLSSLRGEVDALEDKASVLSKSKAEQEAGKVPISFVARDGAQREGFLFVDS